MIGWVLSGPGRQAANRSSDAGRGPTPCHEPSSTEETIRTSSTTMPAVTEGWHRAGSQVSRASPSQSYHASATTWAGFARPSLTPPQLS